MHSIKNTVWGSGRTKGPRRSADLVGEVWVNHRLLVVLDQSGKGLEGRRAEEPRSRRGLGSAPEVYLSALCKGAATNYLKHHEMHYELPNT